MKKNNLIMIILFLVMFLSGCQQNTSFEEEPITLGYCPTMENIAKEIQLKNENIAIIHYDYTAAALFALNNQQVDSVLVGRVAKQSELNGAYEKRLRDGLTLVGQQKRMISFNDLQNSRIHTYVSEKQAKAYFPEFINIVYHNSLQTAVDEGLQELVLIDWNDYDDNLELVIPVDSYGKKFEEFRLPVLYSFDEKIINTLTV